jgi:glycosyltransferase involved in cell wall biosynthesis
LKFVLHVVGLPHTSLTNDFTACAFTFRVLKFCGMMRSLGHTVYLYGGPESEAECTEHIPCISEDERREIVGDRHFVHASFDYSLPHWRKFNGRVIEEIAKRKGEREFLVVIGGLAHKEIADAHPDLRLSEFSIGYGGVIPESFKVFESRAWQHTVYGSQNSNPNAIDGRFYDDVIPGSFDPADFPFRAEKDDYHLFIGRVTERKGYGIAIDACKRLGKRLVIAGQADTIPADCEYVGVVDPEERGRLMAGAQAVWAPTLYLEPFGNISPEAQLCGTPVLCSPFGAFPEHVEDGKTGFHCHIMREWMEAAERVGELDPHYIRDRAVRLYSTDAIAPRYQRYYERLATLWGEGFYSL